MTTAAKGGFPGCPKRRIDKRKIFNSNCRVRGDKWKNCLSICDQIKKNLHRFYEIFGDSDEDEFHGFSSEECGLRAYKRINCNGRGASATIEIPDILCSPIDLTKKRVTTRLAHARNSLEALPSSHRTRRRKKTLIRRSYSKSEVRIVEGNVVPKQPLVSVTSQDPEHAGFSSDHGFTKYKNSKLDFHRLSKSMTYKESTSSSTLSNPLVKPHKTSPIKPATFIAPSMAHAHHVTNVTPTCLKIKLSTKDAEKGAGPGHPKVLAKALLARANRKTRKAKGWDMDPPLHTSTPINAPQQLTKSKSKLFVMPAKSSRSSRIIKVNRRYIDDYPKNDAVAEEEPAKSPLPDTNAQHDVTTEKPVLPTSESSSSFDSPIKGRPLLKEATFRVAALANINNKPLPTRNVKERNLNARIRARKLIKRARFKHPTSSSTLVVGNDFEDETEKKKNLIKEATFKAPNHSRGSGSDSGKDELSDLGLSQALWHKLLTDPKNKLSWTKQEIHNVLHGANTFSNSWTSLARHYDYHPFHRDWNSVRIKAFLLVKLGILSKTLKVRSSILLQLKPRYSDNPNVTVLTPYELRMRGLTKNVECDVGSGGRMRVMLADEKSQVPEPSSIGPLPKTDHSIYLGFTKESFSRMCVPRLKNSKVAPWSVREIHNVLHGIHVFGVGEWNKIQEMYMFHKTHNNIAIRGRFKSVNCRGLVIGGKLRPDILPLLHPKFSAKGKRYFQLSKKKGEKEDSKPTRKRKNSKENEDTRPERKNSDEKKQGASSDNDMTSPPRKQAYHLFGAAPVWDEGGGGPALDPLEDNSDEETTSAPASDHSPMPAIQIECKEEIRERKSNSEFPAKKSEILEESSSPNEKMATRGPRIKHVCRRASLVTGQKRAAYDDRSNPQLSALPKEERERIAAEVERLRGLMSETSASSDDELDTPVMSLKKHQRFLAKNTKAKLNQIEGKRKMENGMKTKRCHACKACRAPKCGDCTTCRNLLQNAICLGRLPCLNPRNLGVGSRPPSGTKIAADNVKEDTYVPKTREDVAFSNESSSDTAAQRASQYTGSTGMILSPDSRHHLQCELHERDKRLPSIVKIDEWKERYEIEDLWNMGGVSLITSTTPSTRFLCFLCGSVGRTRPFRRTSSNSDSSFKSDNAVATPLFIFCSSCCEPFHPFCLDDHEQHGAISAAQRSVWVCKRCLCCNVCGRPDDLLECRRCNKTYHSECLGPSYPTKASKNNVWVCMRCVRCRSCGASKPGRRPGSQWTHDFQLCQRCGDLFDKGNFCPICRRCYRDEDYDSRMIQCGTCKRWVHSRCESLTVEMYTILSHLPDDVQYVCPECDGRKSKVEIELSHNDGVSTDESTSDSIEGDKMRGLLCKLSSPSWKRVIEQEVQSGIEKVMMSLFHNKEAACVLKKSSIEDDSGRPSDLFTVRFAVHNRRYTSVAEFSSDVCAILDTVAEDQYQVDDVRDKKGRRKKTGVRAAFCQEMHSVFPWFDVDTGRVWDSSDVPDDLLPNATLPPHPDHAYAQWQDRDISVRTGGPDTPLKHSFESDPALNSDVGMVIWKTMTPRKQYEDMRQCLFCGKYGDDQALNAERLVYCGQDEWVHVNCALWSAEVFERHDGSLQNVHSAVSRGKMMKCEMCRLPGATVGCNTRDCPQNYHFMCARMAGCSFQEDKKVFCARHVRHVDGEVVTDDGFEVARRVVVDNDEMRPNKRWQRGVNSHDITILLGSATIHQLGYLAPSSDSRDLLIPVNLRMTRIFWSAVHAGRRVRYTITVTEEKPSVDSDNLFSPCEPSTEAKVDSHGNRTISHGDDATKNPPSRPHQPGVESCRSKLVDRLQPAPGPLFRHKSHDHGFIEPGIHRSRRLSGSTYTIVGSVNRTLPQTITPLPTITPASGSFHRLLPTVSDKPQQERNSTIHQGSNSKEVMATISARPQKNENASVNVVPSAEPPEIHGAVKVSPQNPFLNLHADVKSLRRTVAVPNTSENEKSALAGKINCDDSGSESAKPVLSGYIEKLYNTVTQSTSHQRFLPSQVSAMKVSTHKNMNKIVPVPEVTDPRLFRTGCSGSTMIPNPAVPFPTQFSSECNPHGRPPSSSSRSVGDIEASGHAAVTADPVPTTEIVFDRNCDLLAVAGGSGCDVADGNRPSLVSGLVTGGEAAVGDVRDESRQTVSGPKHFRTDFFNSGSLNEGEFVHFHSVPTSSNTRATKKHTTLGVASNSTDSDHTKTSGIGRQPETGRDSTAGLDSDTVVGNISGHQGKNGDPELRVAVCRLPSAQISERVPQTQDPIHSNGSVLSDSEQCVSGSPGMVGLLRQAQDADKRETQEDESDGQTTEMMQSLKTASLWWKRSETNANKRSSHPSLGPVSTSRLTFCRGRRRRFVRQRLPDDEDEDYDYTKDAGRPVWHRIPGELSVKPEKCEIKTRSKANMKIPETELQKTVEKDGSIKVTNKVSTTEKKSSVCCDDVATNATSGGVVKGAEEDAPLVNGDTSHSSSLPSTTDESLCGASAPSKTTVTSKRKPSLRKFARNSIESDAVTLSNNSTAESEWTEIHDLPNGHFNVLDGNPSTNIIVKQGSRANVDGADEIVAGLSNSSPEVSYVATDSDSPAKHPHGAGDLSVERQKSESTTTKCVRKRRKTISVVPHSVSKTVTTPDLRHRSKSADGEGKKRHKAVSKHKNEVTMLMMDASCRRYPRRNTLTCLKSFSGLSPNYAIQSYSSENYARHERANARSIKSWRAQHKISKSKRSASPKPSVRQKPKDSQSKTQRTKEIVGDEGLGSDTHPIQQGHFGDVSVENGKLQNHSPVHPGVAYLESEACMDPKPMTLNAEVAVSSEAVELAKKPHTSPEMVDKHEKAGNMLENKHGSSQADLNTALDTESAKQVRPEVSQATMLLDEKQELHDKEAPDESFDKSTIQKHTTHFSDGLQFADNDDEEEKTKEALEIKRDGNKAMVAKDAVSEVSASQANDSSAFENASVAETDVLLEDIPPAGSHDDSIETVRGIVDKDNTEQYASLSGLEVLHGTPEKQTRIKSPEPHFPVLSNQCAAGEDNDPSIKVGYGFSQECDIVTPLSPQDEPKLPSPMDTDAGTAPFLVTSECPVLNADEVQSLLACPSEVHPSPGPSTRPFQHQQMKPTTSVLTHPVASADTTFEYPCIESAPRGLTYMPINYGPTVQQAPLLVYEQQFAANYAQQPVGPALPYAIRISGMDNTMSNPMIVSPPGNPSPGVYQQTYAMTPSGQLLPVVISNLPQATQFVTRPLDAGHQVMLNTIPCQQTYIPMPAVNSPPMHPPRPNIFGMTAKPVTRSLTHFKTNPTTLSSTANSSRQIDAGKPMSHTAALSALKHTDHVKPECGVDEKDSKLATDQAKVLEQMIEFYSNKNKLSQEEKEMVKAIIAEQIQNKSLPMPSLDNHQAPDRSLKGGFDVDAPVPKSTKSARDNNAKPGIINRHKRQHAQSDPLEIPAKKPKRKRKETHVTKNEQPLTPEKHNREFDGIAFSPLLNVYLAAVQAEHAMNENIARKWRSTIRSLARSNVHIDVPWSSRRGHKGKENGLPPPPQTSKRSHLVFEITSEDGYHAKGPDLQDLVSGLLDAVQECRANARFPHSALYLTSVLKPHPFLGVSHDAIRFLVEQLPGARHCLRYRAKYHKHREPPEEVVTHINPHGCARAEKYQGRSKPDMFSFLASKHRLPPTYEPARTQNVDMQQTSTRRATSMDLPMAMRFRHLRTFAREAVGVYRSAIHGRGLYCKRDIEAGEMVMEYTGEVIRCFLTDHREKMYDKKGIGCYMFRMDDMYVVDATMMGSGARFINHSCEPSCYSRIVHIDGKKHIVIFALRKICRGEELTYDYKFPIEADDQKIMCNCCAKTCRKYMN